MIGGPDFLELLKNNGGFDPTLITCTRCGLGFKSNILFISHMDHHSSKSKYTCATCVKSFVTACAFYAHKCGSKEVPHCEFCYIFNTKTKTVPDSQVAKDNTAEVRIDINVSDTSVNTENYAQKVIETQIDKIQGKIPVIIPPSSKTQAKGSSQDSGSSGNMQIIHPLFSKPKRQERENISNPVNHVRQAETEASKSTITTTPNNENCRKNEENEKLDIFQGKNVSNIVQVNDIDELLLDDSDEERTANYHSTEKSLDTPTKTSSNGSDQSADSVVECNDLNANESPLVWIPSDVDLDKSIKHESPKLKSSSTKVFLNKDLSKACDNINTDRNNSADTCSLRILANTDIDKNNEESEERTNESVSSCQHKSTLKVKPNNWGPKSRKRPKDTYTETDSEENEANKKIRKENGFIDNDDHKDLLESHSLESENSDDNLVQDVESDVDPDDLAYDNLENESKTLNEAGDEAENFDIDDTYICMDCSPLLVLRGAEGLVDHSTIQEDHVDIKPLWIFNQVNLKLGNVMRLVNRT